MDIGAPELLIILVIVVLLFGVGRVGKIGGELGTAVANFRKGLQEGVKEVPEALPKPNTSESPVATESEKLA